MKRSTVLLALCMALAIVVPVLAQDGTATPVPLPSVIDRPSERPPRVPPGPQVDTGALEVVNAWVRPVRAGATTALYLTIANTTADDYTLTAVNVDFAAMTELHESMMQGDMMRMRELEGGIPAPAGERTALRPGGLHVMIMDAARALDAGDAVRVELVFTAADGEGVTIETAARVSDEPLPDTVYFDVVSPYAHIVTDADGAVSALEVFGEIYNWGAPFVAVSGVRAAFAGEGEVRETIVTDSGLATRQVAALTAPFTSRLILRPNGYFARLSALSDGFEPEVGAAYSAVLLFEDGTEYPFAFIVRPAEES